MTEIFITRVFVPRADNDGTPFPTKLFRSTQRQLREKFHGFTLWGEVRGEWVSPSGRVDIDTHCVYEVAHPGRELPWWAYFKDELKQRYSQEEVWIIQSNAGWSVI